MAKGKKGNVKEVKMRNADDKKLVTRGELKEILGQMTQNMSETNNYLMSDLNALFKEHVYPNSIRLTAMVELLIEKEVFTEKEMTEKMNNIYKEAIAKAKKLDEDGKEVEEKEEVKEEKEENK